MIASIGAAHVDRRGMLHAPLILGTSNPGDVHPDLGGVARNVAVNLARLGCQVSCSARVGDDEDGRRVLAHCRPPHRYLAWSAVSAHCPTASYTAILETDGELVIGLADMGIYDEVTPAVLARRPPAPAGARALVPRCQSPRRHHRLAARGRRPDPRRRGRHLGGQIAPPAAASSAHSVYLFRNLAQAARVADGAVRRPARQRPPRSSGASAPPPALSPPGPRHRRLRSAGITACPLSRLSPRRHRRRRRPGLRHPLRLSRQLDLYAAARLGLAAAAITVESDNDGAAPSPATPEGLHAR